MEPSHERGSSIRVGRLRVVRLASDAFVVRLCKACAFLIQGALLGVDFCSRYDATGIGGSRYDATGSNIV